MGSKTGHWQWKSEERRFKGYLEKEEAKFKTDQWWRAQERDGTEYDQGILM